MERIPTLSATFIALLSIPSMPIAQTTIFDLTSIGIQPNQLNSLEDYQGAFGKIGESPLNSNQKKFAETTVIDQLVRDHPDLSTVFNSESGAASIYVRPKTLFSHDMIENGISLGDYNLHWESGPTHFKSIQTEPETALDLIIKAQSAHDNFDADIVGSNLWREHGFFTNIGNDGLPPSVQQRIELIDPQSGGDVGLIGLPNATFFESFSSQPNVDFPWYGDPSLPAYTQANQLNEISILLGDNPITADDFTVSSDSDGTILISGDTVDGLGRLLLSSDPSGRFGGSLIHGDQQWYMVPIADQVGGSIYSFVPIGRGSTSDGAFIERLADEAEIPQGNFGADEEDRRSELITLAPREVVTISFVYSSEAASYLEDFRVPDLVSRFGFSELVRVNGLGGGSAVEFQSVGHSIVGFDGGKNYGQILTEVTSGLSPEAVAIRQHRDDVSADIVALVVFREEPEYEWYCGRVAEIAAASEQAYLVWNINPNCIYRNSLAHEIGHIFGGVHENHFSVPVRPYAYGYALEAEGRQCSTAMSNACTRCDRSGWSSPISQFYHPPHCHGETMGTRERNDVARLLAEFAPILSKFRN